MAAAAAAEVQGLLRFLTQDAKVPLAAALPRIGALRKANLAAADVIAKASTDEIRSIFQDEKLAKQVMNAAKRVTNPRKRPQVDTAGPPSKRLKQERNGPYQVSEVDLKLPSSNMSIEELTRVDVETNRAPLVLAFAVMLIKYTMPEQPLSSRLSLAQAVVSLNSQTKAKSIGLTTDKTAEDDGWAQGQPKVKVLGREVAVMRRALPQQHDDATSGADSPALVKSENDEALAHEAFWGLDLEALRRSNGPLIPGKRPSQASLPIHAAEAARNYLLRSFNHTQISSGAIVQAEEEQKPTLPKVKGKPNPKEVVQAKEEATGMLLTSLDILFESWSTKMTTDELDRKAWSWYVHVRPEVAQGQAGWGQKGVVHLGDILKFRKIP